ncbi:MAG TPA: glycosyltransferase [Steroidobacteraceae bacterium]|jgi:glycosyltransferase involved in cell wall biosynthesis|nr:glycosyltransferase [Steroidobacteraceae bacterium]
MKLTICLATHNGAQFVEELLRSIVVQLSEGDEILVADDASTDDTAALARKFGPAVRILTVERAGGVVPNFERVIAAATGEAIALCDQDDVWLPGRVELIRERLQAADLLVLNGQVVNERLEPMGVSIFDFVGVRAGFFGNLMHNSFVGCCMAFRRSLGERVIPFPAGVPWHDWYIGLVASLIGQVQFVDRNTLLYRRHSGNASFTGETSRNSLWKKVSIRVGVLRAVLAASARRTVGVRVSK